MTHFTRYALILLVGIFVGAGITLVRTVFAERAPAKDAASAPLPLDELRTFTEVFNRIKTDYVVDVQDKKLLEDAVQGMLAGLDPHSSYLDAEGFKEIRIGTEGEFGGLGIEVSMEDGFVKVISPIEDTPAARGGLRPGDIIIRLDEKPVKGMALTEAVKFMRGKPGSDIALTVMREGNNKPIKIVLTRAVIKIQSVKTQLLEDGYGYLRVTQFQSNTGDAVVTALNKLKQENKGTLRGLILDLRNNPGGVLNAAVSVSDAFLTKGLIVYTKGRVPDSEMKLAATPNDYTGGAPIVVLVNGGSASASEIVAGALQDHKRAVVMGTKTFGKGSVQTIVPMSNGAALKITTARYYTPNGRSIQATGIVPDIAVEEARITRDDNSEEGLLKEADLTRHLDNPTVAPTPTVPATPAAPTAPNTKLKKDKERKPKFGTLGEDYQLQEALNLLKGIAFFKQPAVAEAK